MDAAILTLTERVKNTIALGESHFREFKSALMGPPGDKKPRPVKDVCRDIAEALVSFANADGGELLVGAEDDGSITGVPHDADDVKALLGAVSSHVHADSRLPITHATKLLIDGKQVLFFGVTKGTSRIFQLSDGRCVRRKDTATEPADVHQLLFARQEAESRAYDQQYVDGATVNDLDVPLVKSVAESFLRGISVEHYLQQLGLADFSPGELKLRRAALLLFAKDISRWHPGSQVRILKVRGNDLKTGSHYNVTADEVTQGNIFQLLQGSWDKLRPFLTFATDFGADARFEQRYLYPESACREALVNAIAHRAYNVSRGIEVYMYDDRMEIRSPGTLLSTLTLDGLRKLSGAHESRNTLISRVLRENKYMRELGEGLRRIFELMEQYELQQPQLSIDEATFTISLLHKSVFSQQQEEFIKLFNNVPLSGLQKKVVVLGMDGREISKSDIVKAINTKDRDVYDRTVTPLRNAGVLAQIRSQPESTWYAKKHRIRRDEVPRFRVVPPDQQGQSAAPPRITPRIEHPPASVPTPPKPFTQPQIVRVTPHAKSNAPDESCCVFFRFTTSPDLLTREEVVAHFSIHGRIRHVELPRIARSDVQKGFGFVWFDSPSAAQNAVEKLSGTQIGRRRISSLAIKRPSDTDSR